MNTSELFKQKRVFSIEIFPPKRGMESPEEIEKIYDTLNEFHALNPDYISVTYGAGGSGNSSASIEIAGGIKEKFDIESVAHLPAIGMSEKDVLLVLEQLKNRNVENILALRGDNPGNIPAGDFPYASDLTSFIKNQGGFNVIGACYPETHPEAHSPETDIENLKKKVDSGVGHLISQLFLDNSFFYDFLERAEKAGINVPIEAGIMPVVNKKQILRMTSLCGAKIPKKFMKMMDKFEDNPVAMRDAGIAYAVDQIIDLLAHDAAGIHLYAMNNPYIARKIKKATQSLFV
ncbi:MAG: methylenetetrahydrofolate reductase [Clostridiales bacterium]|jgi:methylenetetrahydrofolate reductase (NADPH)|nr:methylenetetrahydrofolate reductase [Clostridiales bacterium]